MQPYVSRAVLCVAGLLLSSAVSAQDAQAILETVQQKQLERWQGVNLYVVDQSTMGQSVRTHFQRFDVVGEDGVQTLFMPVAPEDLPTGNCSSARRMTAAEFDAFASGLEMTGDATAGEIEKGLEQSGLPGGLLSASGSDPTATFDPRVMLGGSAAMMRSMAEHERARAADPDRAGREAAESAEHMAEFMRAARLLGNERVDGREAFHLQAAGLNHVQPTDEGEFRVHTMSLWVDAERYVPLRMSMQGDLVEGNQTRPLVFEQQSSDYRRVPGTSLFEPYRRSISISGMMDAAQEAELRKAEKELADLERQMASMPAGQRAMLEQMMGPRLEMVRNMASGGGFQVETTVLAIEVNPKNCQAGSMSTSAAAVVPAAAVGMPAGAAATGATSAKVAATSATSADGGLVGLVQTNLTALGYETGGTSGEMNTATIVAISKFQAENGLEVTGEVTPQLAGILAARVDGGGSPSPATGRSPEALQQARQACLEDKMAAAQEAQQKKRGFGRLLGGISRVAGRIGGADLVRDMNQVSRDLYDANATAEDLSAAARDLGLTEQDIADCRNPG